jgi:hypothetical protein
MRPFKAKACELTAQAYCNGNESARPYSSRKLRAFVRPTLWQRFRAWLNQEVGS